MKPTESKLGGGGKTGKRPWAKPSIRTLHVGAGTRSGPADDTLESVNYNINNIDCSKYSAACMAYGRSS